MHHHLLKGMSLRTQGIALIRTIPHTSMQHRLEQVWRGNDFRIGILVGAISSSTVELTASTIMASDSRRTICSIDLLSLSGAPMQNANTLITLAHGRLAKTLKDLGQPDRLDILIGFVGEEQVLDEIARLLMEAQECHLDVCQEITRAISRPGDGVVVAFDGTIIDMPIIPRQSIATAVMAEA